MDDHGRCDDCRVAQNLEPRGAKHGPGGRGGPGACDPWCAKCKKEKDQERKIYALKEDFKAGRIKLKTEEFNNEYMGVFIAPIPVSKEILDALRNMQKQAYEYMGINMGIDMTAMSRKINPLDVEYDGIPLGTLLRIDEDSRRDTRTAKNWGHEWTAAQRTAISAHWSAQLRAKVAESSKPKLTVMMAIDAEDL